MPAASLVRVIAPLGFMTQYRYHNFYLLQEDLQSHAQRLDV